MNVSRETGCAIIVEKLLRLLSYKLPGEPRKGFPHATTAESGRMESRSHLAPVNTVPY